MLSLLVNDKKTPSKIFQINNQTNGGKGEILHHSSVCFRYNFHFHFLVMSKNSVFVYLGFHRSPHSMCVQWFCSQTEIPCGHCNTKEKNNIYIYENRDGVLKVFVWKQMEMKLTKCLVVVVFFCFVFCLLYKSCVKTLSLTLETLGSKEVARWLVWLQNTKEHG